jgi:hypothetical protein
VHSGVFSIHKELNFVICTKMGRTGDHNVKQHKPDSERQTSPFSDVESKPKASKQTEIHKYLRRTIGGRG